jgi:hypothetical protein
MARTDGCREISDRLLRRAEKELGAFARAVNKLFGSAHLASRVETKN